MTQLTHDEAMLIQKGLINHALQIVGGKRTDYSGNSDPLKNLRKSQLFDVTPIDGTLVRITDKMSRIQTLLHRSSTTGEVGEKLEDTLADILNYTCLIACLIAEEFPSFKESLIKSSGATPTIKTEDMATELDTLGGKLFNSLAGRWEGV